jgi:hypothetical protein
LTSTIGGLPGEKNKSLIFGALRSMTASSAGVEAGAAAGAVADATAVGLGVVLDDETWPGAVLTIVDMNRGS